MSKKLKIKKPKIASGDVRVGNFIYHKEEGYIKISDVAGMISHRLSIFIPKGRLLMEAMEQQTEGAKRFLENYAVVMFNVMGCVVDNKFLAEINDAAHGAINRHKDIYGIKEDISDKEDNQILQEVKETQEAIKELQDGIKEEAINEE